MPVTVKIASVGALTSGPCGTAADQLSPRRKTRVSRSSCGDCEEQGFDGADQYLAPARLKIGLWPSRIKVICLVLACFGLFQFVSGQRPARWLGARDRGRQSSPGPREVSLPQIERYINQPLSS